MIIIIFLVLGAALSVSCLLTTASPYWVYAYLVYALALYLYLIIEYIRERVGGGR